MNYLNFCLKSLKLSFMLTFLFAKAFTFSAREIVISFFIIFPSIVGLTIILRNYIDEKSYKYLSQLGVSQFKD